MNENIMAGLVSGLIVTLLVVIFSKIWDKVIIPWFEERIYKDIKIEGIWHGLYPSMSDNRQEVISLSRHGHTVSGTMTCNSGGDKGEIYKLSGSFKNMILTLTYETFDSSKLDRGTITLRCIMNGRRFSGKIAVYSDERDTIESVSLIWFRSKNEHSEVLSKVEDHDKEMQKSRGDERKISKRMKAISKLSTSESETKNNLVPESEG